MEKKPDTTEPETSLPEVEVEEIEEKIIDATSAVELEEVPEEDKAALKKAAEVEKIIESWVPKTDVGRQVKSGEITDIDIILDSGRKILEPEISEKLLPTLEIDLLAIGQSKGKFGGGQRRVFRQTQKKTQEGNKPRFSSYAVCGNRDGYVGFGYGKARETVPAREKSFRQCKLNMMKIRRACSSWECNCGTPHTVPFKVEGKCGSVKVTLIPAPKGTGLCAEKEIAKILKLAGIKDVWSKTIGKTATKINHIKATIDALQKLTTTKLKPQDYQNLNIVDGKAKREIQNV